MIGHSPDMITSACMSAPQHGGPGGEYNGHLPGIWTPASDTWMGKTLVRSATDSRARGARQGRAYEYLFNQSKLYEV